MYKNFATWYSEALDIPDGPRDFYGLPGLIMELVFDKRTFQAIAISPNDGNMDIQKPTKGAQVSKTEYLAIVEEEIKAMKKDLGGSGS
ncbi:GLPGLI family protein [Eisenibacter elegans]|uniref:GLPGLI family protein n=1 Tax=Eisenibacter elegans TaxID=997 RepID=UPI00041E9FF8|nr:GLPGLI family protein [Eisenibacter elegans]